MHPPPSARNLPFFQRQVWDPEGVVIIPDHYIFTADPRANRNVDILRDFVNQQVRRRCTRTCENSQATNTAAAVIFVGARGLLVAAALRKRLCLLFLHFVVSARVYQTW